MLLVQWKNSYFLIQSTMVLVVICSKYLPKPTEYFKSGSAVVLAMGMCAKLQVNTNKCKKGFALLNPGFSSVIAIITVSYHCNIACILTIKLEETLQIQKLLCWQRFYDQNFHSHCHIFSHANDIGSRNVCPPKKMFFSNYKVISVLFYHIHGISLQILL